MHRQGIGDARAAVEDEAEQEVVAALNPFPGYIFYSFLDSPLWRL
jgi:hypothetical protein